MRPGINTPAREIKDLVVSIWTTPCMPHDLPEPRRGATNGYGKTPSQRLATPRNASQRLATPASCPFRSGDTRHDMHLVSIAAIGGFQLWAKESRVCTSGTSCRRGG